jgi:hypothetical protein
MFAEQFVMQDGVWIELVFHSPSNFRLACVKGRQLLVEYKSASDYEFKSVEKLRYDFQRDAEDALRQG